MNAEGPIVKNASGAAGSGVNAALANVTAKFIWPVVNAALANVTTQFNWVAVIVAA